MRRPLLSGLLLALALLLVGPATSALAASISGTVVDGEGSPVGLACIAVYDPDTSSQLAAEGNADAAGVYTIPSLPAGGYKVRFLPCASSGLASEFYDDSRTFSSAEVVNLTAGESETGIDAQLEEEATIGGTVTDEDGNPVENACVRLYDEDGNGFLLFTPRTEADGDYRIDNLPAGQFRIEFDPCGNDSLVGEFHSDKETLAEADPVTLAAGDHVDVDAVLGNGASISGAVEDESGNPLGEICVTVAATDFSSTLYEQTKADGSYTVSAIDPGSYNVSFDDCAYRRHMPEYYDDSPTIVGASTVTVGEDEDVTGIDAALAPAAVISGDVTGPSGSGVGDVCVTAYDSSDGPAGFTLSAADGSYEVGPLEPGDYRVGFADCGSAGLVSEFNQDKPDLASADAVTAPAGVETEVDAELVDEVAVTIGAGPTGPTNDMTPTFGFSGSQGSSLSCSLDTGTPVFAPCSDATSHTTSPLADGPYTFRVRASFGALSDTETRTFSVDTVAPSLSIGGGPTGPTNDRTPTFDFAPEAGSSVQCSVDSGTPSFGSCSGPGSAHTPAALADGSYAFRVRATDAAGNATTETRPFSVDATPPSLSITGGPSGPTKDPRPDFGFAADAGTVVTCSIDAGTADFSPCSGVASDEPSTDLADGAYTFRVRAIDAAGNESTRTRGFSVDTTVPGTTITAGPSATITTAATSFSFSSDELGAGFECSLDSGAYSSCSSPRALSGLANGTHTFSVRAVDAAGNTDASPDNRTFTVSVTAPPPPVDPPPPAGDPECDAAKAAADGAAAKMAKAKAKVKKAKTSSAKKKAKAALKKAKSKLGAANASVAAACD